MSKRRRLSAWERVIVWRILAGNAIVLTVGLLAGFVLGMWASEELRYGRR